MSTKAIIVFLAGAILQVFGQSALSDRFEFLSGQWQGKGSGFGNQQSEIRAEYSIVLGGKFMEVRHVSDFAPTDSKPKGEHHEDLGLISYDTDRKKYVFRQFHIEGFVNQYLLIDSLSAGNELVFQTEVIENFIPGGIARWVVKKISEDEIETKFFLSFPGKEFACYGTNNLKKVMR